MRDKEIYKLVKDWAASVSSLDTEQVMGHYFLKNCVLLPTVSEEMYVNEGIEEYFIDFLDRESIECFLGEMIYQEFNKLIICNGFYEFVFDGKDEVEARYTFVFKKYFNKYYIVSHHSSVVP
jgi:hypothetical protein